MGGEVEVESDARPRRADLSPRAFRRGLVAVGLVAMLVSLAVSSLLFPHLTGNSDEGVYLSQADTMASGELFQTLPADAPEEYRPWFSTIESGRRVVYKYTPPFAALLAASLVVTGSAFPGLAVAVAAAVVLVGALARLLDLRRRAALLASLLFLVAPGIVLQTGAYLPYLFTLALLLGAACAVLAVGRLGSRSWPLGVAGVLWGFAFFARPYDAVLFAVPLAFLLWRSPAGGRRFVRSALVVAAGVVPVVLLSLAYNQVATGSAFRLPFSLLEPSDSVGFGKHRVLPEDPVTDYTPGRALWSVGVWLVLVANSAPGGLLFCALALWAMVRDPVVRVRHSVRAFLPVLLVCWVAGYSMFWGIYAVTRLWAGAVFLGPYYFLPVLAVLCISGAGALERFDRPTLSGWAVLAVALVSTAVATGFLLRQNLERTRLRSEVADVVDRGLAGQDATLLLLPPYRGPYLQHPFSWLRNRPDLGGSRRDALAVSPTLFTAIDDAPGRAVFLLSVPTDFGDWDGAVDHAIVREQRPVAGRHVRLTAELGPSQPVAHTVQLTGEGHSCQLAATGRTRLAIDLRMVSGHLVVTSGSGDRHCQIRFRYPFDELLVSTRSGDEVTEVSLPWRKLPSGRLEVLVPGEVRHWSDDLPISLTAPAR